MGGGYSPPPPPGFATRYKLFVAGHKQLYYIRSKQARKCRNETVCALSSCNTTEAQSRTQLKKNLRPRSSTDFSSTDPLEAKDRNGSGPARSQKFAMGGLLGGSGGGAPSRRRPMEVGGSGESAGGCGFGDKAPSRRRNGGLGAEPPALENFAFFCKNNFILGLF